MVLQVYGAPLVSFGKHQTCFPPPLFFFFLAEMAADSHMYVHIVTSSLFFSLSLALLIFLCSAGSVVPPNQISGQNTPKKVEILQIKGDIFLKGIG